VTVGARGNALRATAGFGRAPLPVQPALLLGPVAVAGYYERRAPLDIMGFVKTPYGIMIGFSLVFMVLMPMLKVDPAEMEEYRASQAAGSGGNAVAGAAAKPRLTAAAGGGGGGKKD